MTATTHWSYSRNIAFTVLACILSNGVESRSSSFSDKRYVSPFVRRDDNTTTISNSTTAESSTSTTASSSTQSSNINAPTSTPIFSNTSQPTTFTSSFGANSTSTRILSTSTSLILRTSTLVVISTSIASSSSSSSPIPLVDPTPSITSVLTGDTLPTSSSTNLSTSPTLSSVPVASSNSSSSFWRNKAAIAAVFLVVALIACGAIVIFIIAFFKKRARRRQRLHNQVFGRHKLDPATSSTHSHVDSINSAPVDAFSTRQVRHESPLFFSTQQPQEMASSTVQHTNYDTSQSSGYNSPSLPKTTNSAPPVAYHNRAKRESAQPSIDSFYGAPARQSTDYKIYAI